MPMGMDDQEWEEREMDRLQEEEEEKQRIRAREFQIENEIDASHQARIDSGYYNEFDD